jgi:hypothetical protein
MTTVVVLVPDTVEIGGLVDNLRNALHRGHQQHHRQARGKPDHENADHSGGGHGVHQPRGLPVGEA